MRKLFSPPRAFVIALMAAAHIGYSQEPGIESRWRHGFDVSHNWAHADNNISLRYVARIRKHSFAGGLKVHLPRRFERNTGAMFYKSGRPETVYQLFGLNLGYELDLKENGWFRPGLVSVVQVSNMRFQPNFPFRASLQTFSMGRYFIAENTIGIGAKFLISERLAMSGSAGVGFFFATRTAPGDSQVLFVRDTAAELCGLLRWTARYEF